MILQDLHIIGQEGSKNIRIIADKIQAIVSNGEKQNPASDELIIECNGAIAFPGLINSHDHLDFNLFRQMGNRFYDNYIDWGADLQAENKEEINAVLKIPEALRVKWGIYKNLLAGITTVVNHGKKINVPADLINIFQECYSLHSVRNEKSWKLRLNKLFQRNLPLVMHIGEGTGASMQQEIDQLIRWNLFKKSIIGVHGVAMNEKQAPSFKALVWCPASNYFLYNKTAAIDVLKKRTTILFGTDSTLTSAWNIWDHLRLARSQGFATDAELFDMLTINPARTWGLEHTARIKEDCFADIVIAKPGHGPGKWDKFYNLDPGNLLLVIHKGNIRLFDAELLNEFKKTNIITDAFSKCYINGTGKYIQGNLSSLIKKIKEYKPDAIFPG
jgi:cytosine/adenosine deaminase-related metal-dependent hydrolase